MDLRSIESIGELKNKTVIVRVDYNIEPELLEDPSSTLRIDASLKTIKFLRDGGATIILLTHLGRPKNREVALSTKQLVPVLEEKLKEKIIFFDNPKSFSSIERDDVHIYLFENLRFFSEEETNDIKFATMFATLADAYVNEAFSVSHRAHASVTALARLLPAYAGFILIDEISALTSVMISPAKPVVLLLGGAKVDTKSGVIEHFVDKAEAILLTGALPNPFWKLKKQSVGRAVVSAEELVVAKKLKSKKNIILPIDMVVALSLDAEHGTAKQIKDIEDQDFIVDIGPQTIQKFAIILKEAKTIIWNGPAGIFEKPQFGSGTFALARLIAAQSKGKTYGVVGGGETVTALFKTGMAQYVDHLSTGGGAMLEFLAGKDLPGLEPLKMSEE